MPHETETTATQPVHFFIHIPKCGGNTFSDFLAKQFPLEKIYNADKSTAAWEAHRRDVAGMPEKPSRGRKAALLRQRHIDQMLMHDLVIENHYTWDFVERLTPHRRLVTYVVVRDPKERVASHYRHLRRIPVESAHHLAPEARDLYRLAKELGLAEFCGAVDRADVWATVFNRQTRAMSSQVASRAYYETVDPEQFLANALENLKRADFVADLQDVDEFAHLVSLANGWLPPGRMDVLNPGSPRRPETQTAASDVPDDVVALDLALVDAARQHYRDWKHRLLTETVVTHWRQRRQPGPPPADRDAWDIDFAAPLEATNFHGREGTPPHVHRWMGPERESRVFLPVRPGIPQRVSISIAAMVDPAVLAGTRFCLNGRQATPTFSISDNCTVATLHIPADATPSGLTELTMTVPFTASDHDTGSGTDTRRKSLALNRIRIQT